MRVQKRPVKGAEVAGPWVWVRKRPVKGAEEANPLRFSKQGWELGDFGLESA